jgi:valyl-tRNA synthetase
MQDTVKIRKKILLPPPNVTGKLHMGHAFQQVLMDIIARYWIQQGYEIEWAPGSDHAGIAFQLLVEKTVSEQDRNKQYKRAQLLSLKNQEALRYQMQRLGISVDWTKEYNTLDKNFSYSVKEAFLRLYHKGMIYKGNRLVYWDTHLVTAVSDIEVVYQEKEDYLYHITYFSPSKEQKVVISTTRPETLFGDVALAVHSNDQRYKDLVGTKFLIPLTKKVIPLISDLDVNQSFGTGCMKITPAHDFQDHLIAKRHNLDQIIIFDKLGKLNQNVNIDFQGLSILEARKKIVQELQEKGYLVSKELITHSVPTGDRSGQVLEILPTSQWFLKTSHLSQNTIQSLSSIHFIPLNWQQDIVKWFEKMEDWCISRQIWWGHEIPAWYDEKDNIYVAHSLEEIELSHPNHTFRKERDVLDTWFSSALCPLILSGWPDKKAPYQPFDLLITGFDIIFFWIARMVILSIELENFLPFKNIMITGLIKDEQGKKMSKTKGNVIDPLEIIEGKDLESLIQERTASIHDLKMRKEIIHSLSQSFPNGISQYSVDVLRLNFALISSPSIESNFDYNRLKGCHSFELKIHNSTNFILMKSGQKKVKVSNPIHLVNQAMLYEAYFFHLRYEEYMKIFRLDLLANLLIEFLYYFCDWYLEATKVLLESSYSLETRYILIKVFHQFIHLLYPIMPFNSYKILKDLNKIYSPDLKDITYEKQALEDWKEIQSFITTIRSVTYNRSIRSLIMKSSSIIILNNLDIITHFLKIKEIIVDAQYDNINNFLSIMWKNHFLYFDLAVTQNNALLRKQKINLEQNLIKTIDLLANQAFLNSAPTQLINKYKEKVFQLKVKIKAINESLKLPELDSDQQPCD